VETLQRKILKLNTEKLSNAKNYYTLRRLLTNSKLIIYTNLLFLFFLVIGAILGLFYKLNYLLEIIITTYPLTKIYFPIFFFGGLLLPLILLLTKLQIKTKKEIIIPYIILLGAQILAEIILVVIVGKGMGVVVGLVYSIIRVFQINHLLFLQKSESIVQLFLYFELVLWTFNVLQIIFNRMTHLLLV
tara:strand:- start:185 stop:748 length:564 start_codon:yes stop_codon:yes gene_type:complete